jgi:hypothetical protein
MHFDRLKRREFIGLVSGAAVTWPLVANAQRAERLRRVGLIFIGRESDPQLQARIRALREGLATHGWVEGRNSATADVQEFPTGAEPLHALSRARR